MRYDDRYVYDRDTDTEPFDVSLNLNLGPEWDQHLNSDMLACHASHSVERGHVPRRATLLAGRRGFPPCPEIKIDAVVAEQLAWALDQPEVHDYKKCLAEHTALVEKTERFRAALADDVGEFHHQRDLRVSKAQEAADDILGVPTQKETQVSVGGDS